MKIKEEIGFVLFYIAGFGISEYLVKLFNLNATYFLLYNLFLLLIGVIFIAC